MAASVRMARMHARHKGKSGSVRAHRTEAPDWTELNADQIEEKIVELHGQGLSTSEIGIRLRDQYAVPHVHHIAGKKITTILRRNGVTFSYPEDMMNLMRKVVRLNEHLELHPKDLHNKRSLNLIEAKIRRIGRYYQQKSLISADWKYDRETVKLLVE